MNANQVSTYVTKLKTHHLTLVTEIPTAIREKLELKPDDALAWIVDGEKIYITKAYLWAG
jgi:hypothetical protein